MNRVDVQLTSADPPNPERFYILVVEDDPDALANLVDILSCANYRVGAASTAAEAKRIISGSQVVNVIVLDRRLPDASASNLLPDLHRLAPEADVIIITGYADLDSTIRAMRQGAADYLLKPVNPDALLAAVRRVVERQSMLQAWHEEHEFAERVIDTTETIVLVLGLDGTVLRCNPYFQQITGWRSEDAIGQNWFQPRFLSEEELPGLRQAFQTTVAGEPTRGIVSRVLTRDGSVRFIRWSSSALRDERGEPTTVLAVGLDVTDIIEAQEKALQNERLAIIGQTMAALAHESRNSLQRIRAKVDLLELELGDNPQIMADLESIAKATQDLHRLLEEVRAYAAPIHLDITPAHLPDIWRRAFDAVEQSHPQFAMQLDDQCDVKQPVYVDRMRMGQVFRNLFENSVAASEGPLTIRVAATVVPRTNELRIEVTDNGRGFRDVQLDRVFDAFYTTHPTGTGLGMAIVRRIIEAHNGQIRIDSTYVDGARIVLTLPSSVFGTN